LNPHRLFDANWQKIAVHVVRDDEMLQVELEVESVNDPVRLDLYRAGQGKRG
jgi:hypothetical protein